MKQQIKIAVALLASISIGAAMAADFGVTKGIEQGVQHGISQGITKGVEHGLQHGIKEGALHGLKQGVQQGVQHSVQTVMDSAQHSATTALTGQIVDINSADAKTIAAALSGIGMKKAQAIVDYRTLHGKFKNINELLLVRGIGATVLASNAGKISIGSKS